MPGAVLSTEESGAAWLRPYSHILSPAARTGELPDTPGRIGRSYQGSSQG